MTTENPQLLCLSVQLLSVICWECFLYSWVALQPSALVRNIQPSQQLELKAQLEVTRQCYGIHWVFLVWAGKAFMKVLMN